MRQNSLTWGTRTRLWSSTSIRTAPRNAPTSVPEPPRTLTPPTTAAATESSSRPCPATTVMLPKRDRNRNPANPDSAPQATKAPSTSRRVGRPAWAAASGFEPMAYSRRPQRSRCIATWSTTTITTTTANTTRMSRPPMLNTVRVGRSTTHDGNESAVIVLPSPWEISQLR